MVWSWLGEENARLLLLAAVLVAYMCLGAVIFNFVERQPGDGEDEAKREYDSYLSLHPELSGEQLAALHRLLRAFSNSTLPPWDFAGGFHFSATIVSTIGYGNRVPQTDGGKVAVILYGFLGCSGGILFFNLFLERIISLLAYILGYLHLRKLEKEGKDLRDEDPLEDWKPNVYLVFLCLVVASLIIGISASITFSVLEGWSFIESIYFCFVSFSTIGFGDYVTTQQIVYPSLPLYRVGNFIFIAMGCCCIYSLFNVTSIVIKEWLNWILIRLDCQGCGRASDKATRMLRRHSLKIQQRARRRSSFSLPKNFRKRSDSGVSNTDSSGRRLSGEISMKELLYGNKVSLAVMQKQLYEAAMIQKGYYTQEEEKERFSPGMVGPLAIISNKLEK